MKRFIFGLVAIAAFAMIGLGTGRAAAASSCSALVHTRAGSYEGVVDRATEPRAPSPGMSRGRLSVSSSRPAVWATVPLRRGRTAR